MIVQAGKHVKDFVFMFFIYPDAIVGYAKLVHMSMSLIADIDLRHFGFVVFDTICYQILKSLDQQSVIAQYHGQ